MSSLRTWSQVFVSTPLARTYLPGRGDAGPGARTLRERHAPAMRTDLAGRVRAADLLTREIPASPWGADDPRNTIK